MFLILTAFFFKLVDIIHYLSSRFKGIKRAIASRKDVLYRDLRPLTDSLDLNDLVLGSAESDFGSGDDFKPFDGQAFVDKGRLNIHRRQLDTAAEHLDNQLHDDHQILVLLAQVLAVFLHLLVARADGLEDSGGIHRAEGHFARGCLPVEREEERLERGRRDGQTRARLSIVSALM